MKVIQFTISFIDHAPMTATLVDQGLSDYTVLGYQNFLKNHFQELSKHLEKQPSLEGFNRAPGMENAFYSSLSKVFNTYHYANDEWWVAVINIFNI